MVNTEKVKMNKWKIILRWGLGIVILYLSYILILAFGHIIPKNWIQENLTLSCQQIVEDGLYPSFKDGGAWDNWTDAFLINSISTEYDGSLLEKVVANAYTIVPDEDGVPGHFLALNSEDLSGANVLTYTKYWTGNYTFYKLLLLVMSLKEIRIILLCITIILLILVCLCIHKSLGIRGVLPFLLVFLVKIPLSSSMCLVYSVDIILTLAAMIGCYVLYKRKMFSHYAILFFMVGSLSAYLGYWAFPIITLAMPLIFTVGIYQKDGKENLLLFILKQSVMWSIGLGCTVIVKIILSICVLKDVSGATRLLFRLGTEVGLLDRAIKLFHFVKDEFYSDNILIWLTALSIVGLAYIVRYMGRIWKNILPYLLLAAYPFAWSLVTIGHISHSFDHIYFCIFYYAISLFVCMNIDIKKITIFYNRRDVFVMCCYTIALILLLSITIRYKIKQVPPYAMNTVFETPIGDGITQEFELQDKKEKYLNSIQAIFIYDGEQEQDTIAITLSDNEKILKEIDLPIASIVSREWTKIPINIRIIPNHLYTVKYVLEKNSDLSILTETAQEANPFNRDCVTSQNISAKVVNIYEYQAVIDFATKLYFSAIILFLIQITQRLFNNRKKVNFIAER